MWYIIISWCISAVLSPEVIAMKVWNLANTTWEQGYNKGKSGEYE